MGRLTASGRNIMRWFEEKDRIQSSFTVTDPAGTTHIFDREAVLDNLMALPEHHKKAVVRKITQIEMRNADPNPFIVHVLKGLVGHRR